MSEAEPSLIEFTVAVIAGTLMEIRIPVTATTTSVSTRESPAERPLRRLRSTRIGAVGTDSLVLFMFKNIDERIRSFQAIGPMYPVRNYRARKSLRIPNGSPMDG